MAIYTNINGTFKINKNIFSNVGGTIKTLQTVHTNVNGTLKQLIPNTTPHSITITTGFPTNACTGSGSTMSASSWTSFCNTGNACYSIQVPELTENSKFVSASYPYEYTNYPYSASTTLDGKDVVLIVWNAGSGSHGTGGGCDAKICARIINQGIYIYRFVYSYSVTNTSYSTSYSWSAYEGSPLSSSDCTITFTLSFT